MSGTTIELEDILKPDQLGCAIANRWMEWNMARQQFLSNSEERRRYLFATDTTQTSNSRLPWKNKTTMPKLTQIRDNLYANYMAALFPKRKWLEWDAHSENSNQMEKREAILNYMNWVIYQPHFKASVGKCLLDFIDDGNAFATVKWVDQRVERDDKIQAGYVGPVPVRWSPLDVVMNPIASAFPESPKIYRSMLSMGEIKKIIDSMSNDENRQEMEELYNYLLDLRAGAQQIGENIHIKDNYLSVDGFDSFQRYLEGDYVELLTFYGDLFDYEKHELLQNHVIMVVDRHKVIAKKPNPSFFGYPPIFHAGWRIRQDNLWAMGPLDNLVGMQYRIDHVENLKADVYDLIAYPMLKIKGYVNDFELGPLQRIVTDNEGDVEMLAPPFQILQSNGEVAYYSQMMEEMAGSPKEAMGFRTPGEKTAFEVQRLENAASRIFSNKIQQFEEQFLEPLLNAMLEMARRYITGPQEINVFDTEFNMQTFMTLTADDITGAGRIKPIAARNFAEKAELVQNLQSLYQSGMAKDQLVMNHFSSKKIARIVEEALDLTDYELVQDNVRIGEMAEAQRLQMASEEQTLMQATTPSGLTPDDVAGPDMMQGQPPTLQ